MYSLKTVFAQTFGIIPSFLQLEHNECETHSVERVVAAAAELIATLRAAEVHAAAFGQSVLEAAVWTRCKGRREV